MYTSDMTIFFTFNGDLYKRVDRLAEGSPSGNTKADIFMTSFDSVNTQADIFKTSFDSGNAIWNVYQIITFSIIMLSMAFLYYINQRLKSKVQILLSISYTFAVQT